MLQKQEMEIHISKMATDKEFMIYCTDNKYIKRLNKLGIKPYKEELDDEGNVIGGFYKVPEKQIKITKKRVKTEISDERKEQLQKHMKNIRKSK